LSSQALSLSLSLKFFTNLNDRRISTKSTDHIAFCVFQIAVRAPKVEVKEEVDGGGDNAPSNSRRNEQAKILGNR
jgi:hypothetical protein